MSRYALLKDWARFGCIVIVVAAFAFIGTRAGAQGRPKCRTVEGHLTEMVTVTNPNPLQTSCPITGVLAGTYDFSLGSLTDTPTEEVSLFTAASVIHTRNGDLNLAEAGAIDFDTGNLAALWTVVGGTGKWGEAAGQISAVGNLDIDSGTGTAIYRGELCTP